MAILNMNNEKLFNAANLKSQMNKLMHYAIIEEAANIYAYWGSESALIVSWKVM